MPADLYVAKIPKEQLLDWLGQSTTKAVFGCLREVKKGHEDMVLQGGTLNMSSPDETALLTARMLGRIEGLNTILEIVVEED